MTAVGIRIEANHNLLGAAERPREGQSMKDIWDDLAGARDGRQRSGPRRRSRGGRHRSRELGDERRLYRQARRRAALKLSFITHSVAYASVVVMLLFIAGPRAAFFTAFGWGIGIVLHGFGVLVAPNLRRRLIEREVSREVVENVARERRSLEDRHARSIEQLSASIAHEIRNPITAAKSLVQQMGEDPASRENVEYASVALEELDRVEKSISHLLRFARDEDLALAPMRLCDVLDSAIESFRDRIARSGVVINREVDCEGLMRGDSEKIRRVLINLLGNALDALEGAGVANPSIDVAAGENLAGTEVWVRIRDNGPGIPPEARHKIFSPFYTSKSNGTGLGLALSKKVVDAHGGSLEASSTPGAGAEFLATFPKRAPGSEDPG